MRSLFTILLLTFSLSTVVSQQVAEFRGPGRQGIYPETGLLKKWPETGPELVLKISGFGKGYSQPVFYNGTIYISGTKDTLNYVSAYDLKGNLRWQTIHGRCWIRTYPENRCTPTLEGNNLFIASGIGEICCLNALTGQVRWKVNASVNYKGEIHKHGEAEALLLTDKAVVYTVGGNENSLVAIDKTNGSLIWKSKSMGGTKSYASPVLMERAGLKIILVQTARHLIGINAENGDILWSYDLIQYHTHEQGVGANTNPPVYSGNEFFVTSGYNHPGLMFKLADDGRSISLKWKNDILDCHLGGVVLVDGAIYGSNWQNNSKGKWASLDWETGNLNWEKEWYNKGPVIAADGMLYICEEKNGNVALVLPDKKEFKIISTFKVSEGEGPYWAHPSIYDGLLFIRHGDVLMVYNLKV